MVNFAAISQGYNDRNDFNRNKRLEVMKLFEEFKRSNPYATMADFQSFRDQVSGGRNYLAGGVGNDEALRRIVQTNEAKRQQEERAVKNQEALDRQTFINTLKPQITEELLNMSPDSEGKYDYAGAINNIKTMHGGSFPFDLDITNFVTEPDRQRAVQAQLLEKKPLAQAYIESLSDPNDVNAKEFAQMYSLPDNVANELIKSAKDSYSSTRQEQVQKVGKEATVDLERYAQTYGMTFEEAKDRLDELYSGNDLYSEWVGVEIDGMKATFDRVQSGVAETKTQETRTKADTLLADNRGEVLDIINKHGNSDAARAAIKKILTTRLTPTQQTLLGEGYVDSVFDGLVARLQEKQQDQFAGKRAAQDEANLSIPREIKDTAKARIDGFYNSKDGTFKNDGELLVAAKEMSNLFYIDDNALAVIGSVAKEIAGKDLSLIEKRNIFTKALTDAGQPTFNEHLEQRVELSVTTNGVREPQTFDTYYNSRTSDMKEIRNQTVKLTDDIYSSNKSTEEKIAAIRKLKERFENEIFHYNKVTAQDKRTSIGTVSGDSTYIWLDPTTPWNQEKIDDLPNGLNGIKERLDIELNKYQEELEKEKAENTVSSNNNTTTNNTTTNSPIPANSAFIATTILEELEKGSGLTSPFSTIEDRIAFNQTEAKGKRADTTNVKRQDMLSLLQDPASVGHTVELIKAKISQLEGNRKTSGRADALKKVLQNLEAHLQTLN